MLKASKCLCDYLNKILIFGRSFCLWNTQYHTIFNPWDHENKKVGVIKVFKAIMMTGRSLRPKEKRLI